jgi:hypothetical protein
MKEGIDLTALKENPRRMGPGLEAGTTKEFLARRRRCPLPFTNSSLALAAKIRAWT